MEKVLIAVLVLATLVSLGLAAPGKSGGKKRVGIWYGH